MVSFDVTITGKDMFDYNMYHNYRHFQGILSFLLGCVMLVVCGMAVYEQANLSYILITGFLGLFFTIITPVRIWIRSYQQVKMTSFFRKPIHYTICEDSLTIEQDADSATIPMTDIMKAVDTGKSIVLYITSNRAYILPKSELGEKLEETIAILKKSAIKKIKL